jgi:hypothetical protein
VFTERCDHGDRALLRLAVRPDVPVDVIHQPRVERELPLEEGRYGSPDEAGEPPRDALALGWRRQDVPGVVERRELTLVVLRWSLRHGHRGAQRVVEGRQRVVVPAIGIRALLLEAAQLRFERLGHQEPAGTPWGRAAAGVSRPSVGLLADA